MHKVGDKLARFVDRKSEVWFCVSEVKKTTNKSYVLFLFGIRVGVSIIFK